MISKEQCERIRIYIGESDKYGGKPLYRVIIEEARRTGLAGATVVKGLAGFGASSRIHTAEVLRLSEDLPIIVDIVDKIEKLDSFMPFLEEVISDGMVLHEPVKVDFYRMSK